MSNEANLKKNILDRRMSWSVRVLAIVALAIIGAYICRVLWGKELPNDVASFGQIGDFLGGVFNPLVAAFAFYWLATSVRIQQSELEQTRDTLKQTVDAQNETVKAQNAQTNTLLRSAELQYLTMKIQALNSQIEVERDYLNLLVQQTTKHGSDYNILDKSGRNVPAIPLLEAQNKTIDSLASQRNNLISKTEQMFPTLSTQ